MIAHLISLLRIFLGFALFFATMKQKAVLIFIAGWTDFLDGYAARYFKTQSAFGRWLDPLADKIFIACLYSVFVWEGLIPLWVMELFLARDIFIVIGFWVMRRRDPSYSPKPHFIGKLNTALQVSYPLCVIIDLVPTLLLWSAVVTTILSFGIYLRRFWTIVKK
jgi:cardiolipin synthase (CMP-forming)